MLASSSWVPISATLPSSKIIILSASFAVVIRCVIIIVVILLSSFNYTNEPPVDAEGNIIIIPAEVTEDGMLLFTGDPDAVYQLVYEDGESRLTYLKNLANIIEKVQAEGGLINERGLDYILAGDLQNGRLLLRQG